MKSLLRGFGIILLTLLLIAAAPVLWPAYLLWFIRHPDLAADLPFLKVF